MQNVDSAFSTTATYIQLTLIIINGLICFFSLFIAFFYKHNKSKEDFLIIEKKFIDIIAFLYITFYIILDLFKDKDDPVYSRYFEVSVISVYIIANYTLKISILLEEHYTKIDPSYLLNSLIKNGMSFIYEMILIILVLIYFLSRLFDDASTKIDKKYLFADSFVVAILVLLSILVNIIILKKQSEIFNAFKDVKNYSNKKYILNIINLVFNTIFAILFTVILIISKINKDQKGKQFYDVLSIFTWYFISFLLIENTIFIIKIYYSDFYYYTLSNTCFKKIFCLFPENRYKRAILYTADNYIGAGEINKGSSVIYFHDKLNFPIDEVVLSNFDFVLNCINASLFKVLEKEKVSADPAKSTRAGNTNTNCNTDERLINNTDNSKMQSLLIGNPGNEVLYNFDKKDFLDDKFFKMFSEYDMLDIKLTYFFHKSFENLIKEKKVNINNLKNSLLSHVLENGLVASLLDKNCKESLFSSQKSLSIKTLDKQYSIEFVEDNFHKNIAFFKKYFKFLRKEKNTFIPSMLGIFKIKVNKFREISFIITKNNFLEEFPKDLFNSWQILRISPQDRIELVSSSKERQSLLIAEKPVLTTGKRLSLIEYHSFNDILTKDLDFLKSLQIVDFSIIFLYYELGVNSRSSLEDSKTPTPPTSIHNRDTKDFEKVKDKDKSNLNVMNRISNIKKRTSNQVGNDFSYDNSIKLDLSNLQEGKGFEAINNNLKSMIFFNFENVFQTFSSFENQSLYKEMKEFLIMFFDESYA